jgi:hypothetical protein
LRELFTVVDSVAQHQSEGARQHHDQHQSHPKASWPKHPTDAIALLETGKNQVIELKEAHKQKSTDEG